MVKCLLNFLLIFLVLSVFSFAKDDDAKLKKEFGKDLTHAPYFLRYSFSRKYNKDWKESYYFERKAFLTKYESDLADAQAKEKAEAKAQAQRDKEQARQKKELERKLAARLKAEVAEKKAAEKEFEGRQKNLNHLVSDQQKWLQQMEQQVAQGR